MRKVVHELWKISRLLPDKSYLRLRYFLKMGRPLHLKHPILFTEKLQWLKLYDRNPLYTTLVDKYEVKKYVAEIIGKEHIIPTLAVYDSADEIDFDALPDQFVLKCTHNSGGGIMCKDKTTLNKEETKKKLSSQLKEDYFWQGREWPYKDVKPRIIAEHYLEDRNGELTDYKFFCFDSLIKFLFIATDRAKGEDYVRFDFFDENFNHLPFTNGHPNADVVPSKPNTFNEMKAIACKLSKGIPQVRVDLYEVNGKIYFGEMTFSHWSGFMPFSPKGWDEKLGKMLTLPKL